MSNPSPNLSPNSSGSPITNLSSALYQTVVELPYRSLTTPRQRDLSADRQDKSPAETMPEADKKSLKNGGQFTGPISDEFYKLYTSPASVSSVLAEDPSLSPGDAWTKLYGHLPGKLSVSHAIHHAGRYAPSEDDLKKAAECGHWGPTQPSELFLKVSGIVTTA